MYEDEKKESGALEVHRQHPMAMRMCWCENFVFQFYHHHHHCRMWWKREKKCERETLLSGKVPQGLLLHYQICNVAKFKSFSRDDVINEDDEKVHLIDSDGFKLSPSENDTKITVWLEHAWLSHIISKSGNFSSEDDAKENFVSKTQKILLQLQSQHDDRQCRCRGKFMRLNLQQKEMT